MRTPWQSVAIGKPGSRRDAAAFSRAKVALQGRVRRERESARRCAFFEESGAGVDDASADIDAGPGKRAPRKRRVNRAARSRPKFLGASRMDSMKPPESGERSRHRNQCGDEQFHLSGGLNAKAAVEDRKRRRRASLEGRSAAFQRMGKFNSVDIA